MKRGKRSVVCVWLVVAIGMSVVPGLSCAPGRVEDSLIMKEMGMGIELYARAHDGKYPPDTAAIACALQQANMDLRWRSHWQQVLYVANLTTNDPPGMPIMMSRPARAGDGLAVTRDSDRIYLYRTMAADAVDRLVSDPCDFVRPEFASPADEMRCRERIRVVADETEK